MPRHMKMALVLALGLVVLTPSMALGFSGDRVSGWGIRAPSCDNCVSIGFAFDVRSGRHGQNPRGWVHFDLGALGSMEGTPTCLNVHRKWATIFGQVTFGQGGFDPATFGTGTDPVYFVVVVHGRGAQLRGRPAPDKMSLVGWDTEAGWLNDPGIAIADICANPFIALASTDMFKLIAGDIRVKNR